MHRGLFLYWKPNAQINPNKKCIVNFGPQHPAAHGVLRLLLQLEGELIVRADPHIGLLHRGTEALIESKYYAKSIPYFDRLDYVSMATQEHAYCLAVEQLQKTPVISRTVHYQRILLDEITRILNHMLAVSCHALDIGNMSALFWAFEIRERLMEFYERCSGARMHAAMHSFTSPILNRVDASFLRDVLLFIQDCYTTLNEMHNVLSYNKIWKQRIVNIGAYSAQTALLWGLTGVMARSAGVRRDLRLNWRESYSGYETLQFRSFLGVNGDSFDRFNIRMFEMAESLNILNQTVQMLSKPSLKVTSYKSHAVGSLFLQAAAKHANQNQLNYYAYMEDLIEHFLQWHGGSPIPQNVSNLYLESPKGEFGMTLVADGSSQPYRCKIRSPSYHSLQFLPQLTKNHFVADLAALIGTIDIVFGEIDR